MERSKRGLIFWVLLIASLAVPLAAQTKLKKQLYQASIFNAADGMGVGNAGLILSNTAPPNYAVRTLRYGSTVVKVGLASVDGSWGLDSSGLPKQVVLCENHGPAGDCTYGSDGNIDIDGSVVASMIIAAGISGAQWNSALGAATTNIGQANNLKVVLNVGFERANTDGDGDPWEETGVLLIPKGEGTFIRAF